MASVGLRQGHWQLKTIFESFLVSSFSQDQSFKNSLTLNSQHKDLSRCSSKVLQTLSVLLRNFVSFRESFVLESTTWLNLMPQRHWRIYYEVCHQPWSHKYNKDTTAIKDYNCLLLAVIDIFTLFVTATLNKNIQPDLMSCSNRAVTKFGTP